MNTKIEQRPSLARTKGERTVPVMLYLAAGLVFLVSTGTTIYLCGSMSDGMRMPGDWVMSMAWMRMPGQSWSAATVCFMVMWSVMMVAMMTPSLTLMLSSAGHPEEVWSGTRSVSETLLSCAGYFGVWAVTGAAVFPLGVTIAEATMRWETFARSVPLASGVILVLAGSVQFTAWKARWLEGCREAAEDQRTLLPRARGPGAHGVDLGVKCLRCCGNWMTVLLVAGVMDLGTMAGVTAAITIERIVLWPRRAAHLTGGALCAVGVWMMGRALGHLA